MRLSVNLDDELYAVAKSLARETGISASAAVNLLLRRALAPPQASTSRAGQVGKAGLPLAKVRPLLHLRRRIPAGLGERLTMLLDANVLVAVVTEGHIHHERADAWLARCPGKFATCSVTQGTFLRVHMQIAEDKSAAAA